jgi:hypothetical protein
MRFLFMLSIAMELCGHDLYLRPQKFQLKKGEASVVEFHNGEAFPKSQVPPVLERLREAKVRWEAGEAAVSGICIVGTAALGRFRAPASTGFLITAHTMPNYIELPAAKFEEYLEHESLDSVRAWRKGNGEAGKAGRELYSKYVKSILHTAGADAFVTKPTGEVIEFVPLADPSGLKSGERLTVQILFRGAPAAGLHVEASWAGGGEVKQHQVGRTDAAGKIDIPLDRAGLWKLHAIQMERRKDTAKADWESFWASLTFAVGR